MDPNALYAVAWVVEDEEQQCLLQVFALILLGIQENRRRAAARRLQHRLYLTRPVLLPNPRNDTPWQQLYHSHCDRAFATTMGFDIATFEYILRAGFQDLWSTQAITRTDTDVHGHARPYRRSLDASGGLGLLLHYLNSTMSDSALSMIFALIPSTISRYREFALGILLHLLRTELPEGAIRWPRGEAQFAALAGAIEARHSLLVGAFGTMDGLKTPIGTSSDEDVQNMHYNGWLHHHFVSSVFIFSAVGEFAWSYS